jgi:hypothetical protein
VAQLTVAIVLHALLGIALAGLVWAAGVVLAPRLEIDPLFGYALGLIAVSIAAFLVLVTPWLAPLALAVLAVSLAKGASPSDRLVRGLVRTAPAALGLGLVLGLLNHGPTTEVDSSAYGDMLFYAAKVVSAAQSLFPFRDLTVEGEEHVWVETSWIFFGGVLEWLPGFDPILFQASSAPAFLVAAVGVGGALLPRSRDSTVMPLVAVLAVASVAYPTWLTESPPVAAAVPLAFPLYALWSRPIPVRGFAVVCAALAACFVLTKGFGLIPAVVVAAAAGLRDHRQVALPVLAGGAVLAAAGVVVFALTSAWLLDLLEPKFLPADAVEGLIDQFDRRDTQALAPALLVLGQGLLALSLWRSRAWTFLAVLLAAVAGNWLVGGHGLDVTVGLAVLLAALFFAGQPELLERNATLVAGAAFALAGSAWFRDIAGTRAGYLLVVVLGAGLLLALVPRASPRVAGAAVALIAVGVVAGLGERATTLTRDDRDVWLEVRNVVPSDGIVFTSETGPVIAGDQGWNYYPGIAGRQIYLAGWSNSPLLVDERERARRLALNGRVLSGALEPDESGLSRDYGAGYAVVERGTPVGAAFRQLYGNERYELYRIP